jgi:hypothetical protein
MASVKFTIDPLRYDLNTAPQPPQPDMRELPAGAAFMQPTAPAVHTQTDEVKEDGYRK